jgi:hypothetical protein
MNWTEVALSDVLSANSYGGAEEHQILQDVRSFSKDLGSELAIYEAAILITLPRLSVT